MVKLLNKSERITAPFSINAMKTTYIIVITFFCCSICLSQTEDVIKNCNKNSSNILIDIGYDFEPDVQNSNFGINPKCVVYDKDDSSEIHKLLDSLAKEYIIKRAGIKFYNALSNDLNFKIKDTASCKLNLKFIRNYSYLMPDSLEYHFFIKFNANGKIITNHQIPDINLDKEFTQIIDFCSALKMAQQDEYFKHDFLGISLEYSKKFNHFVWCIKTQELHHAITSCDYFILIDAKTGKIIGHRKHKFKVML